MTKQIDLKGIKLLLASVVTIAEYEGYDQARNYIDNISIDGGWVNGTDGTYSLLEEVEDGLEVEDCKHFEYDIEAMKSDYAEYQVSTGQHKRDLRAYIIDRATSDGYTETELRELLGNDLFGDNHCEIEISRLGAIKKVRPLTEEEIEIYEGCKANLSQEDAERRYLNGE